MDAPSFTIEAAHKVVEKQERRAILDSLQGRFAGYGPTIDEFLTERSEEGRREANK